MKHLLWKVPAWDHIAEPCKPGGCGHGRHGEEWCYAVVGDDGLAGLMLTVFTTIGCAVAREVLRRGFDGRDAYGADLSLHVDGVCPVEEYDAPGSKGEPCKALDGRPCTHIPWTSALQATEFFQRHGDDQCFEQLEHFWLALENRYREIREHCERRAA